MALSSKEKKNYFRLAIATIYLLCMFALYGLRSTVIWWFWIWPLAIAVIIYNVLLWSARCPSCREEFSLKPIERGSLFTTFACRNCGKQCEGINMGGVPGGGGP